MVIGGTGKVVCRQGKLTCTPEGIRLHPRMALPNQKQWSLPYSIIASVEVVYRSELGWGLAFHSLDGRVERVDWVHPNHAEWIVSVVESHHWSRDLASVAVSPAVAIDPVAGAGYSLPGEITPALGARVAAVLLTAVLLIWLAFASNLMATLILVVAFFAAVLAMYRYVLATHLRQFARNIPESWQLSSGMVGLRHTATAVSQRTWSALVGYSKYVLLWIRSQSASGKRMYASVVGIIVLVMLLTAGSFGFLSAHQAWSHTGNQSSNSGGPGASGNPNTPSSLIAGPSATTGTATPSAQSTATATASPSPQPAPAPVPPVPTTTPVPQLNVAFTCASGGPRYGKVCVQTLAGAALTIKVVYSCGLVANARSLAGTVYANGSGYYQWDWQQKGACTGPATSTVRASWHGQTVWASITFTWA